MKLTGFAVYYLIENHLQKIASCPVHNLSVRGGDIFVDDALVEKTQCNSEHEDKAVTRRSADIVTSIDNVVDVKKQVPAKNIKIIEIVDVNGVKSSNIINDSITKGPLGSQRDDKLNTHHKPIAIEDIKGSIGHQYGDNLDVNSGIHEDKKNVAFVTKSKSGRKSQILDNKISQNLHKRLSEATVSLQNLAKSQKPLVVHFAKELQERYGQSASSLSRIKSASLNKMSQLKTVDISTMQQIVDNMAVRVKQMSSYSSMSAMNIMNYSLGRESTLLLENISFSLLGASIGFLSFLYFVSVGYGLAIGSVAVALILRGIYSHTQRVPLLTYVHTGMVVLWAVRLIAFLLHREFISWPEWHEKVREVHYRTTSKMKSYVWLTCGVFYSMMMYPCANRMRNAIEQGQNATNWGALGHTGVVLQILGLLLETIADNQKGNFKRKIGNRNKWCNVGLWSTISHPNYLGEAIFWSGVFLGGIGCNRTAKDWLISTTGLVFILSVLKGAVESLESKHMKNYSRDPEFIQFKKRQ